MSARPLRRRIALPTSLLLLSLTTLACEQGRQMDLDPALNIEIDSMTKRPSGLLYHDVAVGDGEIAVSGRVAEVGYKGYFTTGDMFDSGSFSFTIGAGQVVAGFDEGVTGMRVGGSRQLVIPSHLGYGERGMGPIPGGSTLVFVVELKALGG